MGHTLAVRPFVSWTLRNLGRFAIVWLAAATAVALVVDFDLHDVTPHSASKVLFVPVAVLLMLFVAGFTATVALLLALPVVAAFLAVYLPALWLSRRIVSGRGLRAAAVALAPMPFALLRGSDGTVTATAIAVAIVYGLVVALPPDLPPGAARTIGRQTAPSSASSGGGSRSRSSAATSRGG